MSGHAREGSACESALVLGGEMKLAAGLKLGVEERLGDWVTSRNTTVGCGGGEVRL